MYPVFRKAFSLLAAALMLASSAGPAFAQWDVSGTRYNAAYAYLSARGAVKDGRPYATINRAEALTAILLMQSKYKQRVDWFKGHMSSMPLFIDYSQSDWFAPYVEAGFEADILNGYADRRFRPGAAVRTEEAITMLLRAYGQHPTGPGQWYQPYVQLATQKNMVYGGDPVTIGRPVTRGQFFDMLHRLDTVQTQNIAAFRDPTPVAAPAVVSAPVQQAPRPVQTAPIQDNGDPLQFASQKNFAISIPRLGITDLTITHPKDALTSNGLLSVLKSGVGHLFSYPGSNGKIMVYGHSSSYAWDVSPYTKIFTKVNQLTAGDRVYVTYNGKLYVYQVTGQQTIKPTDTAPFKGKGEELILFTCWPVGSVKSRLIVRAAPVTTVALR